MDHLCTFVVLNRARLDLLDLATHKQLRNLFAMWQQECHSADLANCAGDDRQSTLGGGVVSSIAESRGAGAR
jgi:hypothetical protein